MMMKKRDAPNKTQDIITKKEVEEDPDTEQIPHPMPGPKNEPRQIQKLEDNVDF